MNRHSFIRSLHLVAWAALVVALAGQPGNADAASAGTVNLGVPPPDLTSSVDPNILVTFDDSGSMTSNFMGDTRPFNGSVQGWLSGDAGPWFCAGVIGSVGSTGIGAHAMNGVYYNPNVLYAQPVYADGSLFPNADATLASVWADGIAVNRPLAPVTAGTAGYNNNPQSSASGSDARRTIINGIKSGATDHRWICGWGSYPTTFNGTNPGNSGGPYYYRLTAAALTTLSGQIDAFGNPTAAGLTTLYTTANWEAIYVPNTSTTIDGQTVNQWQNFANWYAYYRTRNVMTRSALSRVFGNLGNNIRVAWQNINVSTFLLPSSAIITNLFDTGSYGSCKTTAPATVFGTSTQPACYRSAFYNWIFQTGANGTTPDRLATIRGGDFFRRGTGNTGATGNLLDPYWQLPNATTGSPARELSCRQNFHMLVTDGYWNESDPTLPSPFRDSQTSVTLPVPAVPAGATARAYSNAAPESRVFWDVVGTKYSSSMANIAFNYWASDLRSDLANNVAPYIPDKTTGITGSVPFDPNAAPPANDPLNNTEIYFNPANDPASWQHVVQFMVTLGIAGKLTFSDDVDCVDTNNDLCKLRQGFANSTGVTGWPRPVNNSAPAIDDAWHAAINSRGSYFSASDPGSLVNYLTAILNSVISRSTSSTAPTLSLSLATAGAAGFSAGFDSSDWSGKLNRQTRFAADGTPINPPINVWDAGCTLTGGTCPDGVKVARVPDSRVIITSTDGSVGSGIPFRWGSLTTAQQTALNTNPVSIAASPNQATWTSDGFGDKRVDFIRGDRTKEVSGSPQFRRRTSVLGAVINAQPLYNASPDSGWTDNFPSGSPEAVAAAGGASYAKFVHDNQARPATVYVGANDGMLHAVNAADGTERWAYVPNTLFTNGNLDRFTDKSRGLVPTVDNKPTIQDVFIRGSWHTVLVGSLRLGGRGIYALDISSPAGVTEAGASNTVLWEYTNQSSGGAKLGYTYSSPNIARLNNGKWVVLVSSGYFPNGPTTDSYDDPASTDPATAKTSLLVIDLDTGNLIRELPTTLAPQFGGTVTYGLSTPGVEDLGGDQVDDLAVAGDLAGNVWRFDLRDASPSNWKVDLLFKTYPSAATNGASGTCSAVGQCPVTVTPLPMRNPATRGIVWIFGTGKFLGKDDRSNAIPAQSFYGIYDYGTASPNYPISPSNLMVQKMIQDTSSPPNRFVTLSAVSTPATVFGWTLPMDIAAEQGERNVVTGKALDSANRILLATLIPTSDDPCTPGRRGALIVLDAATGAAPAGLTAVLGSSPPALYGSAGLIDTSGAIPVSGDLSTYAAIGGGNLGVIGISNLNIGDNYWYRAAWRELLNLM